MQPHLSTLTPIQLEGASSSLGLKLLLFRAFPVVSGTRSVLLLLRSEHGMDMEWTLSALYGGKGLRESSTLLEGDNRSPLRAKLIHQPQMLHLDRASARSEYQGNKTSLPASQSLKS
jgi:hypothetical protein